jgi:hypothetical protein
MEFLILLMLAFYAFIAWAPEEVTKMALAGVWGLMLVGIDLGGLYSLLS